MEDKDYDEIDEVDLKLLRLAVDMGGILVANDYNLNKVAAVQNMPVLNINDLANAVRSGVAAGRRAAARHRAGGQGIRAGRKAICRMERWSS
ncbi:MAG: hypothetical protein R2881_05510 [Eubacteriales bacterium]